MKIYVLCCDLKNYHIINTLICTMYYSIGITDFAVDEKFLKPR